MVRSRELTKIKIFSRIDVRVALPVSAL